ncbi:hypothetical protein DWQ65_06740 [Treponema phagedenis]|uniref:Uncharacterized protein n=1 Tax=Treponema phagedenis TaxID=162 RepID=A0A0B7GTQ3_TREPH|nr:hypothetical protein HMPREF9554_02410 [Treponema phagedenis F0421]QSH99762.1 hypothetical protein DWQ65_06740 [Treponema phagedenis]CEM60365.1 conserved hypothetical protein [Treponema phagedenis]
MRFEFYLKPALFLYLAGMNQLQTAGLSGTPPIGSDQNCGYFKRRNFVTGSVLKNMSRFPPIPNAS